MFVTPFPLSVNIVIDLVAEKSTRFNTNTTLRSVGGERETIFGQNFCEDINSTIADKQKWTGKNHSEMILSEFSSE